MHRKRGTALRAIIAGGAGQEVKSKQTRAWSAGSDAKKCITGPCMYERRENGYLCEMCLCEAKRLKIYDFSFKGLNDESEETETSPVDNR